MNNITVGLAAIFFNHKLAYRQNIQLFEAGHQNHQGSGSTSPTVCYIEACSTYSQVCQILQAVC